MNTETPLPETLLEQYDKALIAWREEDYGDREAMEVAREAVLSALRRSTPSTLAPGAGKLMEAVHLLDKLVTEYAQAITRKDEDRFRGIMQTMRQAALAPASPSAAEPSDTLEALRALLSYTKQLELLAYDALTDGVPNPVITQAERVLALSSPVQGGGQGPYLVGPFSDAEAKEFAAKLKVWREEGEGPSPGAREASPLGWSLEKPKVPGRYFAAKDHFKPFCVTVFEDSRNGELYDTSGWKIRTWEEGWLWLGPVELPPLPNPSPVTPELPGDGLTPAGRVG